MGYHIFETKYSDGVFVSWMLFETLIIAYFVLFLYTYLKGRLNRRSQSRRNGYAFQYDELRFQVFQKLRLAVCFTIACDFCWPIQFIFNLKHSFALIEVASVCIAACVDIMVPSILAVICLRIFACYYQITSIFQHNTAHADQNDDDNDDNNDTRHHKNNRHNTTSVVSVKTRATPMRYKILIVVWLISSVMQSIVEVLVFGTDVHNGKQHHKHETIWNDINFYCLVFWLILETMLVLVLCSFLYLLIRLLKDSFEVVKDALLDLNQSRKNTSMIVRRMIRLIIGFLVYLFGLLGAYTALFTFGQPHVYNTVPWIIVHEVMGHSVLYLTIWYYVQIRDSTNQQYQESRQSFHLSLSVSNSRIIKTTQQQKAETLDTTNLSLTDITEETT